MSTTEKKCFHLCFIVPLYVVFKAKSFQKLRHILCVAIRGAEEDLTRYWKFPQVKKQPVF